MKALVQSDAFVPRGANQETRWSIGFSRLSVLLNQWRTSEKIQGRRLSEIDTELSPSMFGKPHKQGIKLKGAETIGRIARGAGLKRCAD
eukprot:2654445-Pyramimonas_sp.AAC.1